MPQLALTLGNRTGLYDHVRLILCFTALVAIPTRFTGWALAQQPSDDHEQQQLTETIKRSLNSVVLIEIRDASDKVMKAGSGFIASSDGKIVTNYHVVKGARFASREVKQPCILQSRRTYWQR